MAVPDFRVREEGGAAALEARVRNLAASISMLPEAMVECERAGGNAQQAFIDGLPADFVRAMVEQQPMLGALFMAIGMPVE